MTQSSKKVVWVSPWDRVCGIADYSKNLWPVVRNSLQELHSADLLPLEKQDTPEAVLKSLRKIKPELIHFQHEYGLFGGKNPPFYWFPRLIELIKKEMPQVSCVATAHTVISPEYRFPLEKRGWQKPFRWAANHFLLNKLSQVWGEKTWQRLDGVVVHSAYQVPLLKTSGVNEIELIPHFIPKNEFQNGSRSPVFENSLERSNQIVVVFGFFTPEKGQDIAIDAMKHLPKNVHLLLAGGVRRNEDKFYLEKCKFRIQELGLSDRVVMTGFVKPQDIDGIYLKADLVLAPFRQTSGSGSLAQAFARGAAVLASDLPLNREIVEREPDALEFFRSEDPVDCARQIKRLLVNADLRTQLKQGASNYAALCSPEAIAKKHVEFYQKCFEKARNKGDF